MFIVELKVNGPAGRVIPVGRKGESGVTRISFDYSAWAEELGEGAASIAVKPAGENPPYMPYTILDIDAHKITWQVSKAETLRADSGLAEVIYVLPDGVKKSRVYEYAVIDALGCDEQPPAEWEPYLERIAKEHAETVTAIDTVKDVINAEAARQAAEAGRAAAETERAEAERERNTAEIKRGEAAEKLIADTDADVNNIISTATTGLHNLTEQTERELDTLTQSAGAVVTRIETEANNAERVRSEAEQARDTNENARKNAETARVAAETERERVISKAVLDANAAATRATEAAENAEGYSEELSELKTDFNTLSESVEGHETRIETLENEPKVPEDLVKKVNDLERQNKALWDLNKGITYRFETDATDGDKTVPTGGKQASVQSYGGKSQVWNQRVGETPMDSTKTVNGVTFVTDIAAGTVTITGENTGNTSAVFAILRDSNSISGHKYMLSGGVVGDAWENKTLYCTIVGINAQVANPRVIFTASVSAQLNICYSVWAGKAVDCTITPRLFDLTAMGMDDITSVDDPRIAWIEQYAQAHPEYNAGEIISADVESVTSRGVNLIDDTQEVYPKTASGVTFVRNSDGSITANGTSTGYPFIRVGAVKLIKGKPYTLSGLYTRLMRLDNGTRKVLVPSPQTFVAQDNYDAFAELALDINTTYSNAQCMCIVTAGSSVTAYTPYRTPIVRTIPEAVRALDGYGWSAGTARNYIEQDASGKWWYHKNVERVDLGAVSWGQSSGASSPSGKVFRAYTTAKARSRYTLSNALVAGYTTDANYWFTANIDDVSYMITETGNLLIRNDAYDDNIDAFANYIRGTLLYYELPTESVTDITDLMGDALKEFAVESGGTITFDNDALLSVPNRTEYIIALNEVVTA